MFNMNSFFNDKDKNKCDNHFKDLFDKFKTHTGNTQDLSEIIEENVNSYVEKKVLDKNRKTYFNKK